MMNQGNDLVQSLASQYMVDFFVDRPFERLLPESWQHFFSSLQFSMVAQFCDPTRPFKGLTQPPPLGLLALRALSASLSLSRVPVDRPKDLLSLFGLDDDGVELNPDFSLRLSTDEFKRKIKAKKLHEIERIVEVIRVAQMKTGFGTVVDIGAGVGHLTRAISLSVPSLQVHSIEGDEKLVLTAKRLDAKFTTLLETNDDPTTSNWAIPERKAEYVALDANTQIPGEDSGVCLVGVHACGDLSSTIIRMFEKHPNVSCLILFGCCYHKLNGGSDKPHRQVWSKPSAEKGQVEIDENLGYPLSSSNTIHLPYAARELACYAREQYLSSADFDIKQQIYRALLEWVVVRSTIELEGGPVRHLPFRGIPRAKNVTFHEYAEQALRPYPHLHEPVRKTIDSFESDIEEIVQLNHTPFMTILVLRIMIAPLIEACIVDDRVWRLREGGYSASSFPLFDSVISPRNICIAAFKNP